MTRLAEYRDIKSEELAARRVIKSAFSSRVRADIDLARVNAGWELAGSMARWTDGYWSVRWYQCGAYQGRQFKEESEARAMFERITAAEA